MRKSLTVFGGAFAGLPSRMRCLAFCLSLAVMVGLSCSKVVYAETPTVSDTATDWFIDLGKQTISTGMARKRYANDLAWRWYQADATKRDKIPLKPSRGWSHTLAELGSYEAYYSYTNREIAFPWDFAGLNGGTWDIGDPNDEIEYGLWYDYFEGTTPPDGGTNQDNEVTTSGDYTYYKIPKTSINTYGTDYVYIRVTNSLYENLVSHLNGGKFYKFVDNNGYAYLFTGPALLMSYNSTTAVATIGATMQREYYWGRGGQAGTYDGLPMYTVSSAQEDWSGITLTYTCNYFSESGITSGGGSSEPVPSPNPGPTPNPQGPTTNVVNSPTYVTNNYSTINQTDVDLQPVIDALAVHDGNMQAGFDGFSRLVDEWFETIKQVIEGFQGAWIEYTGSLYEDLSDYLYSISNALDNIFWSLNSQTDTGEGEQDGEDTDIEIEPVELPDVDFSDTAESLSEVFPFSIPHDAVTLFGVLTSEPITPKFELTFPSYGSLVQGGTLEVDLTGFDDTMQAVRTFEVVAFSIGLLYLTIRLFGGGD